MRDDLPDPGLKSSGGPVLTPPRHRRRDGDGSGKGLLIALGVIVVLAAAAWWGRSWIMGGPPASSMAELDSATVSEPTTPRSGTGVDMEPFEDLPTLEESDEWLRERGTELSPDPRWSTWLGVDGLVDRFVVAVVNVAGGESPAGQLPFLQPSDTFAVVVEGDRTFADPDNGSRYDALVGTITSVEAQAAARFDRGTIPLLEAGLRELGFVDREFDEFAQSVIDIVLEAEVPPGPLEVEQTGVVWAYADPELEALSPATKHLLRVGPDNLRRFQDWTRGFATASGLNR